VTVTLAGTDLDSCDLAFRIVDGPSSGTLGAIGDSACSAATPNTDTAAVVYTPDAGFLGNDSFTYVVGDGTTESAPATVSITVNPPPPPCAGGPRDACLVSTRTGKGRLRLEDAASAGDDSLSWKWPYG